MGKIKNVVQKKESRCFFFHPQKQFYNAVGINQKRWGQIYRGEIDPTISEAKAIAEYFEVDVTELI
ncbi:helix-turn-helix transcriptional regulator [Draconibacterium halophilum]|uniref:Helix-turn-helix transcriptional regulator n=1 Tax=Draconibacterium halophilum TaxID=2706887 RepID=A0A6C0R984_9BACT|nr:helix-turn-helix transcriptional regulator [Draconibacterium halophilum]QIA06426.1 helix-turn-helix transcriptional regulator [Draconibacterium halophilum]